MKKILMIMLVILLMVPLLQFELCREVDAANFDTTPYEDVKRAESENTSLLEDIGKDIVGVIRSLGTVVSVAVLIVVGIRYMTASVEEKAQYKKATIGYIIGAILVFGITNLLAIVVDISKNI